jgi:CHAT domain-containing protein
LTGTAATEAAVRERLVTAQFVHLGTHGFFAGPEALRMRPNPLALAGVVLAGAAAPLGDPETALPGGDGILTAQEVAELDLGGTDLVMLTACDPPTNGLGGNTEILQRGFALAGVRSVVTSLWKADDESTGRLVELFYENLWHRRLCPAEALRQAQLALLRGDTAGVVDPKTDTQVGGGLPPRQWAGWVLSGDPGVSAAAEAGAGMADGFHDPLPGPDSDARKISWAVPGILLAAALLAAVWPAVRRRAPIMRR